MNFKFLKLLIPWFFLIGCTSQESFTSFVDTKIGSGGHGHVFVGANIPFGAVQLGPTSIPQSWDWCSGYHDSDSTVIGFSHTHLSGTGIGDLFDITVMPITGEGIEGGIQAANYARGREEDFSSGLWSYADRTQEVSFPGYYKVPLTRYNIVAEMTATERVGYHRYTFPASEEAAIVFDLQNGGCWDRTMDANIEVVRDNAIQGYRYSRGWADNQKIYFYAEFSKDFSAFDLIKKTIRVWKDEVKEMVLYGRADFQTYANEEIVLKVAISPNSIEKAKENFIAEAGLNFDEVVLAADKAWNEELSKITIKTKDEKVKKIFYTALYHTMIAPSLFCDSNDSQTIYTTFSLWDTYRAAMPLYTIIHPEKENDIILTMLDIHKKQGKLPVWHLMGCETNCMVGNPGIPVVADAILKGYDGFDHREAYAAMKESALKADRGQDFRMEYGYIPYDKFNESVAYDLEYALADWAVAQVALKLAGEAEMTEDNENLVLAKAYRDDYEYFINRSKSYKSLFDSELGFIRGKNSEGVFRSEYNPFYSSHRADDYCEGNGWQYTWLVPHDLGGLIECFGGKENLISKLDSLFIVSSIIEGENVSADISGLIGQYAHGNEPSHHILYFYTMLGEPWKTADKVREVLSTLYHDTPDGLSGNEDVGQMSAWYILSSLGFYQVEPAGGRYWFGSPLLDEVELKVKNGIFKIKTLNNSMENKYIQSIKLNGLEYSKPYIDFKDIETGGNLVIAMGNEAKLWYEPLY